MKKPATENGKTPTPQAPHQTASPTHRAKPTWSFVLSKTMRNHQEPVHRSGRRADLLRGAGVVPAVLVVVASLVWSAKRATPTGSASSISAWIWRVTRCTRALTIVMNSGTPPSAPSAPGPAEPPATPAPGPDGRPTSTHRTLVGHRTISRRPDSEPQGAYSRIPVTAPTVTAPVPTQSCPGDERPRSHATAAVGVGVGGAFLS